MRCARVPEDEVPWLHLGFYPLATPIFEPLERLVGPIEQVALDPAALGLHPCQFDQGCKEPRCRAECFVDSGRKWDRREKSVLTAGCSLKYCSKRGAVPVITARPPSLGPFGSLVQVSRRGYVLYVVRLLADTICSVKGTGRSAAWLRGAD
jgi:hypothetical protein